MPDRRAAVNCRTIPTCCTRGRWWPRSSTASTSPRRTCAASSKRDPKNANALNALGYTLADRTTRYEEAHGLHRAGAGAASPTIRSSSTAWAGCSTGWATTPRR
ncbi:MAG: hypothetical protein MZV65_52490 [Chromatiales bacterium]|nr:hypothetical protein [Chromatiales bacterium]